MSAAAHLRAAVAVGATACTLGALAACSSSAPAHTTAPVHSGGAHATASPTASLVGTVRTVLASLGLNIHSSASRTASVVGVAAQGALLTVIDQSSADGGWYKVQGETVTGWIVADTALTASGQLTSYQSSRGFNALYPVTWTFAEEPGDTLFRPQQGAQQSIVVSTAATESAFGQSGLPGYSSTFEDDSVIVCGYTGSLIEYGLAPGASTPTPAPGSTAARLGLYAQIRLRFDSAHAMQLAFNYTDKADLQIFEDFYNSITFNYPLCMAPASPAPSPT